MGTAAVTTLKIPALIPMSGRKHFNTQFYRLVIAYHMNRHSDLTIRMSQAYSLDGLGLYWLHCE